MTEAFRLPTSIRPHRYELHLDASLDRDAFDGELAIELTLDEPTASLTLHGVDMTLHDVRVEAADGTELEASGTDATPERETVTLRFPDAVPAGDATLRIRYTGRVREDMVGLYLAEDGPDRCLATQCESSYARMILPCFDEPAFKAVFDLAITTDAGPKVLANMPLDERAEADDGRVTWRFRETPKMSSYLLAFAMGEFEATDTVDARGVPFTSWALGGKAHLGEHARDVGARCIPWYEDYFGIPYAFGKFDQVAIPTFAFGAMENAGLVTYRPNALLLDPDTATWEDRKWVDTVVSHEFAHMWFGNLVTMEWWDDLWLNEAFADWICYTIVDDLSPELDIWFSHKNRPDRARIMDGLPSTHAIYNPVSTPEEATDLFDMIAYGKGSQVLRMVEAYLGREAFRAGIRSYMQEYQEANAEGQDLWRHLAAASDEPVHEIMRSWITQPGLPTVQVELQDGRLRLRQERFVRVDQPVPAATWLIPLVIRYEDDAGVHETRHLLQKREATVDLHPEGDVRWVHANGDDVGYVLPQPTEGLLEQLEANVHQLTPAERWALLRDEMDLLLAGQRHAARYLQTVEAVLSQEDHWAVVKRAQVHLHRLQRYLELRGATEAAAVFADWVAQLVRDAYDAVPEEPADDEAPTTSELRAGLLALLADVAGDDDAVARAEELVGREQADPASVDPNLAEVAIGAAARHGPNTAWANYLETYEARRAGGASPQEMNRYLYTLARFQDPEDVEATLRTLEDGTVPNHELAVVLAGLLGEPAAGETAWSWLKENFASVRERAGESGTGRFVGALGQLHPRLRGDVEAFLDANLGGSAPHSRQRALEELEATSLYLERVGGQLQDWATERA